MFSLAVAGNQRFIKEAPSRMAKKVLMITYAFPPIAVAGTQRSLRFCRYLPENGWFPVVLTIRVDRGRANDFALLKRIPPGVRISRTPTIDFWRMYQKWSAREQKVVKGNQDLREAGEERSKFRKARWLITAKSIMKEFITLPDHAVFWVPFALAYGAKILLREKIDVIYTSTPPHSQHITGLLLSKLFRKPWIADFRDPWIGNFNYQGTSKIRESLEQFLEGKVIQNASKVMITSESWKQNLLKRYPNTEEKVVVFYNGYDPALYETAPVENFSKFTILYSGIFYRDLNPRFFLKAIRKWLNKSRRATEDNFQILFFGPNSEDVKTEVAANNLESVAKTCGVIPQDQLIPKQKGAHLLLLIVGFNEKLKGHVPAKVFEYMAAGRPILAIIPDGETAGLLRGYGKAYMVNKENEELVADILDKAFNIFVNESNNPLPYREVPCEKNVNRFNGREQTKRLAKIFTEASTASKK